MRSCHLTAQLQRTAISIGSSRVPKWEKKKFLDSGAFTACLIVEGVLRASCTDPPGTMSSMARCIWAKADCCPSVPLTWMKLLERFCCCSLAFWLWWVWLVGPWDCTSEQPVSVLHCGKSGCERHGHAVLCKIWYLYFLNPPNGLSTWTYSFNANYETTWSVVFFFFSLWSFEKFNFALCSCHCIIWGSLKTAAESVLLCSKASVTVEQVKAKGAHLV